MGGTARPRGVLVVDDDAAIRRSLERGLRLNGFQVRTAADGRGALGAVRDVPPDVLVLDVAMPGTTGVEVCATLREEGHDLPILMLSAPDETADRIAGLQAGGDDYLVKPFALQELVLRLHALLRRRPPVDRDVVRVAGLEIDAAARTVHRDGVPVNLTRREFALLEVLARNAGLVLTRDQLLERVWGYDFEVRTDAVDTFVSYLRRKLEAGGHHGRGVPPAARAEVFRRFHRGPGSTGSGLGLTLVAQQAALHGGTVEVGERPGGAGARFTVRLPAPGGGLPHRRDWFASHGPGTGQNGSGAGAHGSRTGSHGPGSGEPAPGS